MSKSSLTAAAFILSSQAVWADVTPDEVWQNWQGMAAGQGTTITAASTETNGDTLVVKGVVVTMTGTGGNDTISIDELRFTDKGDGTVAIVLPDSYPIQLHTAAAKDVEGAKPVDLTLNVSMPGANITASGVPQSLSYATEMPVFEVSADTNQGEGDAAMHVVANAKLTGVKGNYLVEAGESGTNMTEDFASKTLAVTVKTTGAKPGSDVDVTLSLADIAGKAELTGMPATGADDFEAALKSGMTLDASASYGIGSLDVTGEDAGAPMKVAGTLGGGGFALALDANKFHYDATGKSVALNVAGTDGSNGEAFTLTAALSDLSSKIDIQGANWSAKDSSDFPAALKAGLTVAGGSGLGASSFDFAGGASGQETRMKLSLGGADTGFSLDASKMHFNLGSKALSVNIASPEIPVPDLSADLSELAVDLAMPVAKSTLPAPFTVLAKVVDFKVADSLWAMVDPAGSLPHDPATLIIDTKGSATLTKDLMTEATAMEGGSSDSPGLLNTLDIPQILARVAGAEVTAMGAFTFDNSDVATIPGMPMPSGKIDIKATGLNALIDKLVKMGLLPQDQAMQGRMMLSMFANTDAAKDEITSTLEFKDKHFYANGQQLN
ncbi:MAG: DUF2125 domain-containing protein [bacterium]